MKAFVLRAAKLLGLFAVSSYLTRYRVRVLGYHGIWFLPGHFGNFLFMSPAKFESRMAWLHNSKYSVISLDRAVESLRDRGKPEPYSTVITIDDGWFGTYRYMLPSLEARSLPATLYVYTGAVEAQTPLPHIMLQALVHITEAQSILVALPGSCDSELLTMNNHAERENVAERLLSLLAELDPTGIPDFCHTIAEQLGFDYDELIGSRQFHLMRFDELSDAERRGLDIQLHTHNHLVSTENAAGICEEVRINREKLAPHVTSSLNHFCYPSGIHCEEMYRHLAACNIKSATVVEVGLASPGTEPYAIKRILDGEEIDEIEFEAELSGFLDIVRQAKTILRRFVQL